MIYGGPASHAYRRVIDGSHPKSLVLEFVSRKFYSGVNESFFGVNDPASLNVSNSGNKANRSTCENWVQSDTTSNLKQPAGHQSQASLS